MEYKTTNGMVIFKKEILHAYELDNTKWKTQGKFCAPMSPAITHM